MSLQPKYTAKVDRHLSVFVKAECANWDTHYQCCADDKPCKVLCGQPCAYFERAVLGPPDYPYKLPGYDYRKLFDGYGQINPKLAARAVVIRKCECGASLQPRERVCEKCRAEKRRQAYRQHRQKRRNLSCATVKQKSPQNIAV